MELTFLSPNSLCASIFVRLSPSITQKYAQHFDSEDGVNREE
uniref:Uncharacterized protein n=1 Tax=Rhizophora mucronata TaxID=61149 RepID=A0A2P2P2S0_RHIMU